MKNHPNMMPMMPFPFQMFGMPPQQERSDMGDRIPSRVAVAMKFLQNWMEHQHITPAIAESDSTTEIEMVPGLAIDDDNKKVRRAACDLLDQFFNGSYELKDWEINNEPEINKRGAAMVCMGCGGHGRQRTRDGGFTGEVCQLCMGAKHILVFPYAGQQPSE